MKLTPVTSPAAIQQAPPTDNRQKAISAFNAAQFSGNAPVQNQNAIAPEEMGALGIKKDEELEAGGQTDNLETQVTETIEEKAPQEDPAVSKQFAQLARQERALRLKVQQQEQAIQAREAALAAREAAVASKDEQYRTGYIPKERLTKDAWGVLNEHGITYDQLTEQVINQTPRDPRTEMMMDELKAEIKALRDASENTSKGIKEQQNQAYQAAVKQIETDVNKLVFTDPAFETIKETGSTKDVVELIEQTYQQDGVLLSVEEAAQMVEDYLMEEAIKLTKISKIKKHFGQMSSATQDQGAPGKTAGTEQRQLQPMKTLTNAASSSRQLSAKERAILAFKGELKS